MAGETFAERSARIVRSVPAGMVATYGQVAAMAGEPRGAREVVRVLRSVDGLPWHRIVSSKGVISLPGEGGRAQRALLEKEGVRFEADGSIPMRRFQWPGVKDRQEQLGL